jgi:hypothetical protein
MMIKNNKIKILLIIVLIFIGIKIVKEIKYRIDMKNTKELVMKELVERYDETFEIKRTTYDKRKEKWMVEVYPLENNITDETFVAQVTKYDDVIENYYIRKITNLTTIYYTPIIKKIFKETKLYFWTNLGNYSDKKLDKIKSVNNILNDLPEKLSFHINMQVYEDVTSTEEKKEKFLKKVWKLFKYLKSQNLKWASIYIGIYNPDDLNEKEIEIIKESGGLYDIEKEKFYIWIREKEYYEIKTFEDIKNQLESRE